MRRMREYRVPYGDPIPIDVALAGTAPVAADEEGLRFWVEHLDEPGEEDWPVRTCWLQAFGNDAELPSDARWRGSAVAPDGTAWHLYELKGGRG